MARQLKPKDALIEDLLQSAEGEAPGLNTAIIIAAAVLRSKKDWSGKDCDPHYITVGFTQTDTEKRIIGILHDVIEDSDWTLDHLRRLGFSERIVRGVDGVTRRKYPNGTKEKYFDFIERCSLNPDCIDVKLADLSHNMSLYRNETLLSEGQKRKLDIYIISYNYLMAVKDREMMPGANMAEFMQRRPALNSPALLAQESSFSGCPPTVRPSLVQVFPEKPEFRIKGNFFDFIEQSACRNDAVERILQDLAAYLSLAGSRKLMTPDRFHKLDLCIVSYNYLTAIRGGRVGPGTPIADFMERNPGLHSPALLATESARLPATPAPAPVPG